MSARDDYNHAYNNRHRGGALGAQDCDAAMDEIDRLRAWKEEAITVIDMWERCYDAVEARGSHALLGTYKSDHVLKWIKGE